MSYSASDLATRVMQTKRLNIFDLDGSLAAGSIEARKEVRELSNTTAATVFATARTPELTFSSRAFNASVQLAKFTRQAPKIGKDEKGLCCFGEIESSRDHIHMLDPEAVIAFGTGIWIKSGSAFYEDETFLLVEPGMTFRSTAQSLLQFIDINNDILNYRTLIEIPGAYEANKVDVEALPYRIQLDFDSLVKKLEVHHRIIVMRESKNPVMRKTAEDLVLVDESNPVKGRYTMYIMPSWATKDMAVTHFVTNTLDATEISRRELTVFYAGDTLTDVPAGLKGAPGTKATFMLVGGSRLFKPLTDPDVKTFAGEDLVSIKRNLLSSKRPGFYEWRNVNVILADEAYPGTIGAESILAYMKDKNVH